MTLAEEQELILEMIKLEKRVLEIKKLLFQGMDAILEMVEKKHRWRIREKSRIKEIVKARNEFFYLAREQKFTYCEIGDFLDFNHATVMHGIKQHKKTLKKP